MCVVVVGNETPSFSRPRFVLVFSCAMQSSVEMLCILYQGSFLVWNVDYQVVQCVCSQCSSVYPSIHTKVLGASPLYPAFMCIIVSCICPPLHLVLKDVLLLLCVFIKCCWLHRVCYQCFYQCVFSSPCIVIPSVLSSVQCVYFVLSLPLLQYLEILEWGCICMCDGFCFGLGDYWNDCQTLTVGLLWNV